MENIYEKKFILLNISYLPYINILERNNHMKETNFTAFTRFKTNRPYMLKKITVTLIVTGIVAYLIVTRGIAELISVGISFFLFRYLKIRGNKKEKLFKSLWNSYKHMFQKYIIDKLPVNVKIDEDNINITLNNAERFYGKIIDENYIINKKDIKGILFYDEDNSIIFNYEKADVILSCKTKNYGKTVSKQRGSVMLYLTDEIAEEIKNGLKENGYTIIVSTDEKIKEEEIKKAMELTEVEKAKAEEELKKEEELQTGEKKRFHIPTNDEVLNFLYGGFIKPDKNK